MPNFNLLSVERPDLTKRRATFPGRCNCCREVKIMNISARNVLEGTVKEVKKGTTTSHVLIDVKGLTITASITNEAVDELGLTAGLKVQADIKSSDVMVAVA